MTDASPPAAAPALPIDWQSVWGEHARWLRTVLAARGVDRGALDEVLQDVMAEAVRSAERLRDVGKLGPWIYRIAVAQALQYRRRLGRRRKREAGPLGASAGEVPAAEPSPLAWLLAEEQRSQVRTALAGLPRRDAEILLLKYTEDWSYRQLAERLGISESAVEARLHRARGRLRQALAAKLQA